MAYENQLRIEDTRNLIRLTREIMEIPTPEAQMHFLADRLAHLFHAKVVFIVQGHEISPDNPGRFQMLAEGGWIDSDERKLYDLYWAGEVEVDPAYSPMRNRMNGPTSFLKDQLVSKSQWYMSDHYNDYRRKNKLDEFIYCSAPNGTDDGTHLLIGINREEKERAFNERERLMVELINQELLPIFRSANPVYSKPLARRQRQVLERLLAGDSEKEGAIRIGISVHTFHDHVKQLFKRYNVSGRAQLMSKLLFEHRGGGHFGNDC